MRPFTLTRFTMLTSGVGLLALASACASDPHDIGFYDDDYRYASGATVPLTAIDRAPLANTRTGPATRSARPAPYRQTAGIDSARAAHNRYTDPVAEQYDGQCERIVRVRRGETLSDIAEYCDVPVLALLEANPEIRSPRTIRVGQRLRVPNARGAVYEGTALGHAHQTRDVADHADRRVYRGQTITYTVRPGDTLSEISDRFHLPRRTIRALNRDISFRRLQIGDEIRLPADARTHRPLSRDQRRYSDALTPALRVRPVERDGAVIIRLDAEGLGADTPYDIFARTDQGDSILIQTITADEDGAFHGDMRPPQSLRSGETVLILTSSDADTVFTSDRFQFQRPQSTPVTPQYRVHERAHGETLAVIAQTYDVSMRDLRRLNPHMDWQHLANGQEIHLPPRSRTQPLSLHDQKRRRPARLGDATAGADDFTDSPSLSVLSTRIADGRPIELRGDGFTPGASLNILIGEDPDALIHYTTIDIPSDGFLSTSFPPPRNVYGQRVMIGAVEAGRNAIVYAEPVLIDLTPDDRSLSHVERPTNTLAARTPTRLERGREPAKGPFAALFNRDQPAQAIADGAAEVAIAGVLTDEGQKCPALRDDAGKLYSILGDLEQFDDGDRVLIVGTTQADDSICGQGETLQLWRVSQAPW